MQCFSNFFCETEPFAVILVAHGTHARSQEFVLRGQNSRSSWGQRAP